MAKDLDTGQGGRMESLLQSMDHTPFQSTYQNHYFPLICVTVNLIHCISPRLLSLSPTFSHCSLPSIHPLINLQMTYKEMITYRVF
jgi:hypothetical protein